MTSLFDCSYFVNSRGQCFMKKYAFIEAIKERYPKAKIYQRDSHLKVILEINETLEGEFNCYMIKSTMGRQFFVNDLDVASHLKLDQYTLNNFHFRGKGARDPNIAWKFADEFHKAIKLEVDEHHDICEPDGDEYDYSSQKNFD